jgi:plastocyanin
VTHRRTPSVVVVAALSLGLVAGACSDKSSVGQGLNTDISSKLNELSTTTTLNPDATTTTIKINALNPTTTATPRTTVAPVTTVKQTTTTTIDTSFQVGINGDSSGKNQFDPNQIQVRVNGLVKFTNNDSKPRSVVSQDGAFRSPDIAPGQSWTYKATKSSAGVAGGVFHLTDGTRGYVTATMQVF